MTSGFKYAVATAVAGLLLAGSAQAADADRAFYERAFVLAADARCDLFEAPVAAALTSARAQARGAALRAGMDEATLSQTEARARARAAATACATPDLKIVSDRVKSAFSGWERTARMTWPGNGQDWVADRMGYSRATWRLSQSTIMGRSPVTFGYAATDQGQPQLQALVSFVGRSRPMAARIWLRDTDRYTRPWLPALGQAPLPHADSLRAVWASDWTAADKALLSKEAKAGEVWHFPASAADAIARLDPRETFVVQFLFRDDTIATARFEAGDFAAAQAFLAMGTL